MAHSYTGIFGVRDMKIRLGDLRAIIQEAVRDTSIILLEKAGDKCLNCGTSKELDDDNFCGECGANVSEICVKESCKAQVSVDDDYCGECGAPQFRRDPAAKKHIEQAREYQKRDDEIALRKKLWKDAGGTSGVLS